MMKKYIKKIKHEDCVDVLRYAYLANRYYDLLALHKDNESMSADLKFQWFDKYVGNSVQYNIKSMEIFKENNIPFGRVGRFEFNLADEILEYCLREADENA